MTSFTRSIAIVELVCWTGSRPPSGIRSSDAPGWQSTKYSPISDCGRISQWAARRRSASQRPAIDLHDLQLRGLCGADARHLEVAALCEPEGVVAEQLVGLATPAA